MISIVLPTYNGAKYLRASLDSILNQTDKSWELIVVDDCSTDGAGELAEQYAKRDYRIRVIHNPENRKLPASLNIGFREAKGEFLTWTSDDNIYAPNALEKMRIFLEKEPEIAMVCAGMRLINEAGEAVGAAGSYDEDRMYYNNSVGACFLYRSKVRAVIGEYNEALFGVEDYEYWLRLLDNYGKIGWLDEPLYLYRMHERSLTATRWLEIKTRLNEMRIERFDQIFKRLQGDTRLLSALYFDMLLTGACDMGMERQFRENLPELEKIHPLPSDGRLCIAYGAGEYGDRLFELLGQRIAYYADKDQEKIGTQKNGIPIIGMQEMADRAGKFHVVIALGSMSVYEVAQSFLRNGVTGLSSFQHVMCSRIHAL